MKNSLKRVDSIDVFRAITMLLMIFVNDLWSLSGIPEWLEHSKSDVDFLGFSDIIFPSFLFILGMSIPFAIQNRISKGDSKIQLLKHIIIRSVALLVMGLYTVNLESINQEATGLKTEWFEIIMAVAFFMIWNLYPKVEDWRKYLFIGIQLVGVGILIWLAVIYRGNDGDKIIGFSPLWWGILGLIGWSYLASAVIFVFTGNRLAYAVIAWVFFTVISIAGHAGWLQLIFPNGPHEWILGNGAFHSFTFMGIIASLILEKYYNPENPGKLIIIYLSFGLLMIIAGLISREFFIISKIRATPTWIFLCCGISFIFYAFLHWLVDSKGKASWFNIIKTAGTSTLTCYLIPYLYYSIANLYGFTIPESLKTGVFGLGKSFLYALVVVGIAYLLGKIKIKLKI